MKILIFGYPYVRKIFFDTFLRYPNPDELLFLLPKKWSLKSGTVFTPPIDPRVQTATAYFNHSQYPLIGGILKGWMPALPLHLWRLRGKKIGLLYSCVEPILLTALYNAVWARIFGVRHLVASWENIPLAEKYTGIGGILKILTIRLTLALSDGIVVGNKAAAQVYASYTNKPLRVIPLNGVNPDFFKPYQSTTRIIAGKDLSGSFVFSFIGAIGYRKGIHRALEAFAKLHKEFPHTRFVIAGSGDYEVQVTEQIATLELRDAVIRVPWLSPDELRDLLAMTNVFLYPSMRHRGWREQFGYSIAEASLMEVPVIATRSGSIPDVVEDGVTGLLVKEDSSDELYKAMRTLIENNLLRISLGKAGRESMIKRFSSDVIAKKFSDFFHALV
jgi:glycosyltransferase involved in cell wall biosynthesis